QMYGSDVIGAAKENQSENDCLMVEKEYDKEENPKVIAPGMFKLNVSQCLSPISMSKLSCDSNNVEIKLKRKRRKRKSSKQNVKQVDNDVSRANSDFVHFSDLDTFSSVRRPKNSGVIWKKKRSSNTSNVGLSAIIDSGGSKHMTGNRALLTNFVEKFLRTVRFGNNDFAVIAGYQDVVIDGVDLLTGDRSSNLYTIALNEVASNSSTCLLEKAFSLQYWLWHLRLSHLNFATINNLMKNNLVQGLPKMKFEKDHLCSACEQGKIHRKHHKSKTASHGFVTPQQNGVVERRNRTLVEAARTMLTFANLPLFFWAEAIATACFTQNHSIIHKRFDKSPYELINKRKPNIKFFRVFGCRCYLLNDYEDVEKLKAKGDIGVFVRYSKESTAFRIYNKRTRKIYESVNVNFDEISKMASKQFSLEPGLSNLNKMRKSSNRSVSKVDEASKKDLEDLFQDFYDEYFDSSKIMKSSTTNVETLIIDEVFHEISESFQGESFSSSLNDDVQQSPEEVILPSSNTIDSYQHGS
nr:integrase, catalytic region, zinc finger, CCHC-type, peptidase aspartic, catalytic [Tanacetum cinerariifolium]